MAMGKVDASKASTLWQPAEGLEKTPLGGGLERPEEKQPQPQKHTPKSTQASLKPTRKSGKGNRKPPPKRTMRPSAVKRLRARQLLGGPRGLSPEQGKITR